MNPKLLLSQAKDLELLMIKHRRYLHEHPELGFNLKLTKDYVTKELSSMGYKPIDCGKCGLIALAGNEKSGKTFLLRADMDALPIYEQAAVDFPSKNEGQMHACGHDLHTAMLLGAAKLLKDYEQELKGTVKLMFQPSEETLEGAKDMLKNDVLKNPDVDAGMMIHVIPGIPFSNGTAIVCDGGVSAPAADYFQIDIQGKGCHGAMPELGIDPIHIASHIVIALQELHARELSMSDDAVLTIGSFQAGNANNVIPDIARLTGTLRAFDETVRNRIKLRLTEICTGIAKTFRGRAEVTFTSGCPTLLNDDSLSKDISNYCKELLGKDMAFSQADLRNQPKSEKTAKATGSEDFSYISHEIPTVMVALSAGNSENGFLYPLHHPKVTFDETVLSYGASIYTYTAMRWLEENFETLYY